MEPKLPQANLNQVTSDEAESNRDAAGNDAAKLGGERQRGAVGWVFLWLIGIPIPILLLLFFVRGCT